jgi:GNAT superfamily N-acetyltransferase
MPIRPCTNGDFIAIWEIINDGAQAYRGVIPADRWHEPYMTMEALRGEINAGVRFFGLAEDGALQGVMGIQDVAAPKLEGKGAATGDWPDVTLIRHAYVRTSARRGGVGGKLLAHLMGLERNPLLIGTWAAATWALEFYQKHGFWITDRDQTRALLNVYWTIPERQIETSVVLAEAGYKLPEV